MNVYDNEFKARIENLITTNTPENDWLDYKQEWHKNKVELLKDILCFTNTYHNEDCYLIFGVADKTFDIIGVEHDENRKNTQMIIDMLTSKDLSNEIPQILVITLDIHDKKVDVLIVFNTKQVPLFFNGDFSFENKYLHAGKIFTRTGDTNTPIDKTAHDSVVEKLYKKRFHLDTTIYERYKLLIHDVENWTYLDKEHKLLYNFDPDFYILMKNYTYEEQESLIIDGDYYPWLANVSLCEQDWKIESYIKVHFMYGQHKIFDISPVFLFDSGRGFIIRPKAGNLKTHSDKDYAYLYLLETELDWHFMCLYKTAWNNSMNTPFDESHYSTSSALKKVVIYKNENEKDSIECLISTETSLADLENIFNTKIIPNNEEIEELTAQNGKYGRASLLQNNISKAITNRLKEWRSIDIS